MNLFLFCFTRQAAQLGETLLVSYQKMGYTYTAYAPEKYTDSPVFTPLNHSLQETVASCFRSGNALVFISACGIAVRSIAPYIQTKQSDPCVIVIDELGHFVIPLLSGHIGGGNELARTTADLIDATLVLSTATDLHQRFAVDVFAVKNGLTLSDFHLAKKISANLLDGACVGICGLLPNEKPPVGLIPQRLPHHLFKADETKQRAKLPSNSLTDAPGQLSLGICISPFTDLTPYPQTLHLIPRQTVLGIGCKKDTPPDALAAFVSDILQTNQISPDSITAIASIDLKKEEPALLALAAQYEVPFLTYDTQTLLQIPGHFTASAFVKQTTGVENVCERACLAFCSNASLYLRKTIRNGMTLALAFVPLTLYYEI